MATGKNRKTAQEKTLPWIIIFLLSGGLVLLFSRLLFWDAFIRLIELAFSSDGLLEMNGIANVYKLMFPMVALHLGLGLVGLVIYRSKRLQKNPFFNQLEDQPSVLNLFLTSTLASTYIYGLFTLPKEIIGVRLPIHREDSVMEYLTAIAYLIAAYYLIRILFLITRNGGSRLNRRYLVFYIVIILICVLIAGEEISWGQRIFGWETPIALKEINYQEETNLHNLLSPLRKEQAVLLTSMIFPILIIGGWLKLWDGINSNNSLFFPHPAMFIALVFIAVSGSYNEELFEELAALFVLIYAVWMWGKWKIITLLRASNTL